MSPNIVLKTVSALGRICVPIKVALHKKLFRNIRRAPKRNSTYR